MSDGMIILNEHLHKITKIISLIEEERKRHDNDMRKLMTKLSLCRQEALQLVEEIKNGD